MITEVFVYGDLKIAIEHVIKFEYWNDNFMEPATGLPATHMPVNLQKDGKAPTTAVNIDPPRLVEQRSSNFDLPLRVEHLQFTEQPLFL